MKFLRAAILCLFCIALTSGVSQASHTAVPSEPLLIQGSLPPEAADGPYRYWTTRKKYFLVIAVDQTAGPKTNLPFAQVDGQQVVEALTKLGYQPLDPAHPLLTGPEASRSAIMASIEEA